MKDKEKIISYQTLKKYGISAAKKTGKAWRYLVKMLTDTRDSFWLIFSGDFASEKEEVKKNAVPCVTFFAVLVLSALVSSSAFGAYKVYPAGFALLSGIGTKGKGRNKTEDKNTAIFNTSVSLTVFAGVLISALFVASHKMVYFLCYMALFLIRSALSDGKLDENIIARLFYASFFGTVCVCICCAMRGFTFDGIFGIITVSVLSPILCYLFYGFAKFSPRNYFKDLEKKTQLAASFGTVIFLFVYVIKDVRLIGFSPAFIISVVLVFAVAKKYGALFGAVAGAVSGMAVNTSVSVASLTLSGFFAGVFFEYSNIPAFMISYIVSLGYAVYSGGLSAFAIMASDYTAGIIIAIPFLKTFGKNKSIKPISAEKAVRKETVREAKRKLKKMSDAFSSLSEVFYTVSDTMKKPQFTETTRLVSDSFSEVCSKCEKSGICWGKEYSNSVDMTSAMAGKLLADEEITKDDFNNRIFARCTFSGEIAEKINRRYRSFSGSFYKNNKTRLLAGEYSAVSKLIKNTAGDINKELEYNPALEEKAKKVLYEIGFSFSKVAVFGTREMKIDVYGVSIDKIELNTVQILSAFEEEFGFPFDNPDFLMLEESAVMRLKRKRKYTLECAKAGCMKKGEVVNGDSTSFFETDRDFFYTLICDGMGSGREAAFTSRLASIFIEKLMCCQSPKNLTFDMLNAFLMSKSDETFTTVDLFEMDLLSGEGNFIKAGAAPTFIVRNDRIHKIESKTMPYGIIENTCAEKTTVNLRDGDIVIMMSDGVWQDESGEWILKFISECEQKSAGEVCDVILEEAKERGENFDDISISVVKVLDAA